MSLRYAPTTSLAQTRPEPRSGQPTRIVDVQLHAPPDERWFVLQTRARQEKAIAQTLAARGVAHFLPCIERTRRYQHRKRTVQQPLFPGYVFLHGTVEDTWLAIETKRLARVIDVPDQQQITEELAHLRAALNGGAALEPCDQLTAGRRVRVTSGPFAGVEGVIESHCRADRLILQIHALQRATALEIDADLLEIVDDNAQHWC